MAHNVTPSQITQPPTPTGAEQIGTEPYKLPTIELSNVDILNGEFDYEIKGYESHPTIKAPLSN